MKNENATKLADALFKAFVNIGVTNGTKCPRSQDPIDEAAHELLVSSMGETVFKKRKENAVKGILETISPKQREAITDLIANAKQMLSKQEASIATGQHYGFVFEARTPANKFDKDKLGPALRKKGWTPEMVEALIAECTEKAEPAKSYKAIQLRT